MRTTPLFMSAPQNGQPSIDFFEMLVAPFSVAGNGWDKWLTTEESQKLNARWQDTADCRVSMNAGFVMALDQKALNARDDRVMTFNWCTRNEGVSVDQLQAKHQQMAATWNTDSPVKAWTILAPSLGIQKHARGLRAPVELRGRQWPDGLGEYQGERRRLAYADGL